MTSLEQENLKLIIFFDGFCHLCNGFVDFVSQSKTVQPIFFAPLQGLTAEQVLPADQRVANNTIIVSLPSPNHQRRLLSKSEAVLQILTRLRGWKILIAWLARVLLYLPSMFRDPVYDWVARNRYSWFGKRESCRLPSEKDRAQLLP